MDYDGYFADALIRLRSENRYRVFIELNSNASLAATRTLSGIPKEVHGR
jgi:hypothetical protein